MRLMLLILVFSCAVHVSAKPIVKHKVDPTYPPLPWQAQLQGDVKVVVELDVDGNVISTAASGAHPMLRRAAEQNVRLWTFSNVTTNEHTLTITYSYRILEPTKEEQWGTRLPDKFELPDRVEITVYRAWINT
jgi:Gram-negative bacterial TonB protein C-terminal